MYDASKRAHRHRDDPFGHVQAGRQVGVGARLRVGEPHVEPREQRADRSRRHVRFGLREGDTDGAKRDGEECVDRDESRYALAPELLVEISDRERPRLRYDPREPLRDELFLLRSRELLPRRKGAFVLLERSHRETRSTGRAAARLRHGHRFPVRPAEWTLRDDRGWLLHARRRLRLRSIGLRTRRGHAGERHPRERAVHHGASVRIRIVDDTKARDHARRVVFGKSITRPPKGRPRHLEPVPPLPLRSVLIALLALLASAYALVRHYLPTKPSPRPEVRRPRWSRSRRPSSSPRRSSRPVHRRVLARSSRDGQGRHARHPRDLRERPGRVDVRRPPVHVRPDDRMQPSLLLVRHPAGVLRRRPEASRRGAA